MSNILTFINTALAGNIIPAIATTNAIVAGLIVIQALKVIENKLNNCRNAYIREKPILPVNRLIVSEDLPKANPKCYVCASKPEVIVKLNLSKFTIKQLETKILKQELNMIQPDVEIDDGTGRIIISSEEGETEGLNFNKRSFYKNFQFEHITFFVVFDLNKKTMTRLYPTSDLLIRVDSNVMTFFKILKFESLFITGNNIESFKENNFINLNTFVYLFK